MPSVEEINETTTRFITNDVGNGLFAAAVFEPGDIILRIRNPYILVLDNNTIETLCYHCLSRVENLPHCARCKSVRYCSKDCQTASWQEIHKYECKIFRKVKNQGHPLLPTPVRALLQVLLRYSNSSDLDSGWNHLRTHRESFAQQSSIWPDVLLQARGAVEYGGFPANVVEFAISTLCCMKVNAFSATEPDDAPIGLCFEPTMAKANHSCLPNAFVSFDGRCVLLKALKSIANGEELFISYVDSNLPLAKRQQQMENRYLFRCQCPKCTGDLNVYEAFLNNPCRRANKDSIITQYEELEARAQRSMHMSTQKFANLHDSVENLLSNISKESVTPEERWKNLKRALEGLPLQSGGHFVAVDPYPVLLRYLMKNYDLVEEHEASLVILLILIFRVDPYEMPEPWHPIRVTSLHSLADTLGTIYHSGGFSIEKLGVIPPAMIAAIDLLPCIYAILLLVAYYTPLSHGASSKFMEKIRQQLLFMESQIREQRHQDGLDMLKQGIREAAGREMALKYFRQLEALADVDLMLRVVATVDCTGPRRRKVADAVD